MNRSMKYALALLVLGALAGAPVVGASPTEYDCGDFEGCRGSAGCSGHSAEIDGCWVLCYDGQGNWAGEGFCPAEP